MYNIYIFFKHTYTHKYTYWLISWLIFTMKSNISLPIPESSYMLSAVNCIYMFMKDNRTSLKLEFSQKIWPSWPLASGRPILTVGAVSSYYRKDICISFSILAKGYFSVPEQRELEKEEERQLRKKKIIHLLKPLSTIKFPWPEIRIFLYPSRYF